LPPFHPEENELKNRNIERLVNVLN